MVFDIKQVYNSTHTSFWHASDHTTIGSGSFAKKYLSYRTVQLDADINLWLTSVTVQKERKKKDKKKKKEKKVNGHVVTCLGCLTENGARDFSSKKFVRKWFSNIV